MNKTKKNIFIEKRQVTSNFKPSNDETRVYIKKDPSTKKVALSFIFHMSPLWPMYMFWGWAIPCRVISDGFCSNCFKLVSTPPPNSQTLNQKIKLLLRMSSLLYQIFLISSIWWWLPQWRTHGGSYMCEVEVVKIQYHNIENSNMPRFLQHWRILPKLQLWRLLVNFFMLSLHVVYVKKSLYDRQKHLMCSPKNNCIRKMCVKQQWAKESLFEILT